jgi:hypothetical protein
MKTPKLIRTDWKAAAAALGRAKADTIPPGWKTAKQIGQEMGRAASNVVTRIVVPLIAAGRAEVRPFMVAKCNGHLSSVPHYRLK